MNNNSIHIQNYLQKNSKIKLRKGNTRQSQHISIQLPTQIETNKQNYSLKRRSNCIYFNSSTSFKSSSTTNKNVYPLSEVNSNSSQSIITTTTEKDILSQRQNCSTTFSSVKGDLSILSPNNQRCHRDYSSTRTSIQKETCQLLGPQLCSNCIQINTRENLSSQHLTNYSIRQRLTALALRRFIKNENKLSDKELIQMIDNQQIELTPKRSNQLNLSITTDEQYFDQLSKSLSRYSEESSKFYFKDLKDLSEKCRSNKSEHLFLSQTPVPRSSNPLFNQSSVEKFDISSSYSYMKRASTIKPNLTCQTPTFVSPNKIDPLDLKYRSLRDYRPIFILQNIPNNSHLQKRTLIGSRYYHQ